ncbi:MAG TPA: CoA-transferase [Nocardioides sp.]|uniref:CoA-transferase n=1 Tax=Nocardioides sp. TaxID=35761 RepID=UPI002E2F577F|nr:CoA-transferase [Nocardioides sp.]HEX3930515.1 CoA-transferase [Nocardioides sp.]
MSKLTDLGSAVRDAVEPGISLHLTTAGRAGTRAVLREFHGEDLGLTLIMCRVGGGHAGDLVASGLVRRVIAGSYGALGSGYVGPMPQIQGAFQSGDVSFQHWSFLSLTQRLQAAAQGLPFATTHSLVGASMVEANAGDIVSALDPFGLATDTVAMRPLTPDVSILHALAADEDGNTIVIPPQEDGAWGALASSRGAIVTVEHIVSRDFIRRHSHLVRLPGRYVRAVCHVPFGAHPGRFGSRVLRDLRQYEADEEFDSEYVAASQSSDELTAWLRRWVLDIDQTGYLARLGASRLSELQRPRLLAAPPRVVETQDPPSANETLMALAMREVADLVRADGHDVLLVGVGLSEVPAVAARRVLADEGIETTLAMGHGFFGFEPSPGQSEPDVESATMSADAAEIYGVILGGARRSGLAILGAAQVDRWGNTNSTVVDGKLITGSGGSNDAASVCDVIVVTRMSTRKLVDEVAYITCPGHHVRAVVTDRGVFRKAVGSNELELCAYVAGPEVSDERALDDIAERCGWSLRCAEDVCRVPDASADELTLIRWLMPARYRT